ncbi:hypothetical protein F511_32848 [Dorcoceras hygrometricum]|uniref:Uncharacterized protein n=1 Tax=Dorcoceras hygrometricum TaxID=472368 RepID=A0A2Z7A3E9_9LAMI|nr:hypothetical protein F511_32848 [Dorcoceras hygrometricum]
MMASCLINSSHHIDFDSVFDEEMEQFDVFTEINTAERTVGTDADAETMDFGTGVGDQQVQTFVEDPADEEMSGDGEQAVDERIDADEAMSLEDIILSIPVDVPLPYAGVAYSGYYQFVASITSERTVLRSVQILSSSAVSRHIPSVSSTDFVAQRIPLVLDQHSFSSSSSDASIHFDDHDTATTAFSRPVAATPDVTEALSQLQASIDQIRARDGDAKLKDILLMHLHGIEQRLTACLDDQDRVLKVLCCRLAAMDTVDVRRVVKELEAKVIIFDEQVAATRNDLLEFSAQAQQTLNIITDQLRELVAYINRGGNDKKGEVVSSSRPQPPPDDQNRGSGNTGGRGDTDRSVVEKTYFS